MANANGISFFAMIQIPHNAHMTAAILYGSEADETWELRVVNHTGGGAVIAGANINTEDTSILGTNDDVRNNTLGYFFKTSTLDATDVIYGAQITYTTDYD